MTNSELIDVDWDAQPEHAVQPAQSTIATQPPRPADADVVVRKTPEEYAALAERLVFDADLWQQYYDRCQCFASVNLYGHKTAATVAAVGLKGMSLGMSFMQALDRIKVIHGTPVIRGPAAIDHIHERCPGARCRCVTSTATEAVWEMVRPGWEPKRFTFTWEQAERAALTTKPDSAYKKYPERCLKWQAASEGAQEMFGDVLGGLYFVEEIEAARSSESPAAKALAPNSKTRDRLAPDEPKPVASGHDQDEDLAQRVSELITRLATLRGATEATFDAVRRSVYKQMLTELDVQLPRDQLPDNQQLSRFIGYLESACQDLEDSECQP